MSPFTPPAVKPEMYEMNGIRLKDYAGFDKKWKQVTVRFRADTGEQRFVYANDIAYGSLLKEVKDYPDGAVFAKIAVMTQEDPAFTSSRVPAGRQRIQIMLRDKKKYAATGGWGYALFSPMGTRLDPSPPMRQAEACDACHQMVKEGRGEVFAQPMNLWRPPPPPLLNEQPRAPELIFSGKQAFFKNRAATALPKQIRELLPPKTASLRFVEGSLRDHVFSGTLNEIQPFLTKESARSGKPALFLSRKGEQYTLVFPAGKEDFSDSCPKGGKVFKVFWSSLLDNDARIPVTRAETNAVCVETQ
jgi:hypothetical protein